MNYSWGLFRDKINSKVPMLAQFNDPHCQFNMRKFNEYAYPPYDDEDCNPKMTMEEIEYQWQEQEKKIWHACMHPTHIKQTTTADALKRVLVDLDER